MVGAVVEAARHGIRVPAGVYFYRLTGDDWSVSGRVLRLR